MERILLWCERANGPTVSRKKESKKGRRRHESHWTGQGGQHWSEILYDDWPTVMCLYDRTEQGAGRVVKGLDKRKHERVHLDCMAARWLGSEFKCGDKS